jgi:hypothetical protein
MYVVSRREQRVWPKRRTAGGCKMYSNFEMMKQLGRERDQARLAHSTEQRQASVGEKSAGFQTILKILFQQFLVEIRRPGSRPRKRPSFRQKVA